MRKIAKANKNDFEIDFFKLMGNSLYGKTVENVRKRTDIRLVSDEKGYQKLVNKPTFEESRHFGDEYDAVMAVHMRKTSIMPNKLSYIGFCVLEISKLIMYKFHYEWIVNKYGNDVRLLMTDTDSLCYCISSATDVYADMYEDKHLFDLSSLHEDSKYYDQKKYGGVGQMKDEMGGKKINEFVGLRSKVYSLNYEDAIT